MGEIRVEMPKAILDEIPWSNFLKISWIQDPREIVLKGISKRAHGEFVGEISGNTSVVTSERLAEETPGQTSRKFHGLIGIFRGTSWRILMGSSRRIRVRNPEKVPKNF